MDGLADARSSSERPSVSGASSKSTPMASASALRWASARGDNSVSSLGVSKPGASPPSLFRMPPGLTPRSEVAPSFRPLPLAAIHSSLVTRLPLMYGIATVLLLGNVCRDFRPRVQIVPRQTLVRDAGDGRLQSQDERCGTRVPLLVRETFALARQYLDELAELPVLLEEGTGPALPDDAGGQDDLLRGLPVDVGGGHGLVALAPRAGPVLADRVRLLVRWSHQLMSSPT